MIGMILANRNDRTAFSVRNASAFTWKLALNLILALGLSLAAQAQSSFQDGEGAVEYNQGAAPATPTALPSRVRSTSDGAASPIGSSRKGLTSHVGRRAAEKYMGQTPGKDSNSDSESSSRSREFRQGDSNAHYLAIHIGLFTSDVAYKWGAVEKATHPANYNMGVTYRLGEWINSMDLNFRVDFTEYSLQEGSASKLSFLPMITFPDVASQFPLYFGVGAGLGIFMHQLDRESSVALEYQVIGGLRFFNVLPNTGFFLEGGLKNHVLLLTDGQFNGPFVALGSVFLF